MMIVDYFLLTFITVVVLVGFFYPISGYFEIKKLKSQTDPIRNVEKIKFYYSTIMWSCVPVLLILALILYSDIDFKDIGFKWIDISAISFNRWIKYSVVGFYVLYFFYSLYSIIVIRTNEESRRKIATKIPDHFRLFLPVSSQEKKVWTLVCVTAGVNEEIIYRGYFFYVFGVFFPQLSIIHILIITTGIFGFGHIYLGREVVKSTLLGLLFGIFFIIFDSIIPVIVIHIMQDLTVRDILSEPDINQQTTTTTT